MNITERRSGGDVVILELSGRLVIGDDSQARERIANLLAVGERKILIGMGGVSVMDSSGVGVLVSAHNAAESAGAEVKFAQLSPRVGHVLKITRLIDVLDTFDSLEGALSSFS